jgi:hypothetical protein
MSVQAKVLQRVGEMREYGGAQDLQCTAVIAGFAPIQYSDTEVQQLRKVVGVYSGYYVGRVDIIHHEEV